jgi:hypothetical protein
MLSISLCLCLLLAEKSLVVDHPLIIFAHHLKSNNLSKDVMRSLLKLSLYVRFNNIVKKKKCLVR